MLLKDAKNRLSELGALFLINALSHCHSRMPPFSFSQTLKYSNNPYATLFNGTLLGGYQSTDEFLFAAFASGAFESDVAQKVSEQLGD